MNDLTTTAPDPERRARPDLYDAIDTELKVLAGLKSDGDERARLRADILRRCSPLARHIARCYCGRGENYDDLYRVAYLGLIDAVDSFEPVRDGTFLCFAVPAIMGQTRRYLHGRDWSKRVPQRLERIARRLDPTIDALERRLSRMPTASEIAAELGVDIGEVTQAMIATRKGTQKRDGTQRKDSR
ncbi:sigma factor [Nocardia sp. CDC160]|uniref:sigma factor n=1 Tax=Nocardia sp. CDC160 TaxID=3112166 RepID=UPI002DBC554F|nr:sigma factor [Nocardia sp. CDC160]MEC3916969.1 sigma factor [Nocardia sp. CDC160]